MFETTTGSDWTRIHLSRRTRRTCDPPEVCARPSVSPGAKADSSDLSKKALQMLALFFRTVDRCCPLGRSASSVKPETRHDWSVYCGQGTPSETSTHNLGVEWWGGTGRPSPFVRGGGLSLSLLQFTVRWSDTSSPLAHLTTTSSPETTETSGGTR